MAEFLRPRFIGPRFGGGGIPLELLGDLKVLQDLVIGVAKWRYLQEHPDRQRVPKGFADGVAFNLIGIDRGSAIPMIDTAFHSPKSPDNPQLPGMPGKYEQYFIKAQDSVVDAIAAAERGESPAKILPEQFLAYFDRFGSRLREGESVEVSTSTRSHPARLTRDLRRRLVLASHLTEFTQEVSLRGSIPEADQARKTFQFQPLDGRRISGVMAEENFRTVLDAFNSYSNGGKVFILGIGKHDRQERLVKLDSIEEITLLHPLDVPVRLHELRGLKEGWLDGKGQAPRPNDLEWLAEQFERLYPDDLPLPYIYPTVEGGVQAEWSLSLHEASLTIDPASREGTWHVLYGDVKMSDEKTLTLSEDSGWKELARHIRFLATPST